MPPNFFKSFADAFGAAQSQSRGFANQLLLFDLQRKAAAARQQVANEQADDRAERANTQALARLEVQRKHQIGQLQEQARLKQVSRDRLLPPGLQELVAQRFGVDITTPGGEGLMTGTPRPFPITFGGLAGFESAARAFPRTSFLKELDEFTVLNRQRLQLGKRGRLPPSEEARLDFLRDRLKRETQSTTAKTKDPTPVTVRLENGQNVNGRIVSGVLQVPDGKGGFKRAGPYDIRVATQLALTEETPRVREIAELRKLEEATGTFADQVGIISSNIEAQGKDADLGLGLLGRGSVAFTNLRARLTAGGRLLGKKLDASLDLSSYEGVFSTLRKAADLNDNIRGAILDLAFLKASSIRGNRISDKEISKQIRSIVGGVTTGRAFVTNIKRALRRFDLRFQRRTLTVEGFRRSVLYKTSAQVKVALRKGFFGKGESAENMAVELILGIRNSQRR